MHKIPWFIIHRFSLSYIEMTTRPQLEKTSKFDREDNPMEDSLSKKKANPKVEIHDLLRKHFTNGIWKVNPHLRFRDL